MDFNRLAEIATGEVILLRPDRITVRHGNTQVDIHDGLAIYADGEYYQEKEVDQREAEALVQGASF